MSKITYLNIIYLAGIVWAFLFVGCNEIKKTDSNNNQSQYRGTSDHNGVYQEAAFQIYSLNWDFQSAGSIRGTATSSGDLLYSGSADGNVYALQSSNGAEVWRFKTGGAVHCKPAVFHNQVFFTSRDNCIYSIDAHTGKMKWKFQTGDLLPHDWGWEHYLSSPVVSGSTVYVGAGDGNLYALSVKTGAEQWRFKTSGRIRSTPVVKDENLYLASFDGFVYALNTENGKLYWKFETDGVQLSKQEWGWDRLSIDSSPAIQDSLLVFGSRDGNVYALNRQTGRLKWKFTYGPTWAIASPAIYNNTVMIGWSDNNLFSAIDLQTGEEQWKFSCKDYAYSSPAISGDVVYFGSHDRNLYALNTQDGSMLWNFRTGGSIFSSPELKGDMLFIGSDDGKLYALKRNENPILKKAVYAPNKESKLALHFKTLDYSLLDAGELKEFLSQEIDGQNSSVIIFTATQIPEKIVGEDPANGIFRKYLEAGGKIVWLGMLPNLYKIDNEKNTAIMDATFPSRLLDMQLDITHDQAIYYSQASEEGKKWGLPNWFVGSFSVPLQDGITVLATNEYNRASAWVKKFSDRPGSGFVQVRTWGSGRDLTEKEMETIRKVAEYEK